jgi:hypothetical protein
MSAFEGATRKSPTPVGRSSISATTPNAPGAATVRTTSWMSPSPPTLRSSSYAGIEQFQIPGKTKFHTPQNGVSATTLNSSHPGKRFRFRTPQEGYPHIRSHQLDDGIVTFSIVVPRMI